MKEYDASVGCVTISEAAEVWRPLARYVQDGKLDLGNPTALQEYNKAILFRLTGYSISVPEKSLIPAICLRNRYLDVVEDCGQVHTVVDVGTGASAVIALLASHRGWKVFATEIDPVSIESAEENFRRNEVSVELFQSHGGIITGVVPEEVCARVDMTLCYPPFYPNDVPGRTSKRRRGFQGKDSELFGGETGLEFTERYIEEVAENKIRGVSVLLHRQQFADSAEGKMREVGYQEIQRRIIRAGNRKRYVVIGRDIIGHE